MESPQSSVSATRGSTVTLPCHYHYEPELTIPRKTRVKWSWLPANTMTPQVSADAFLKETEVMVAMGSRHRSYGSFRGRVRLRRSAPGDMSLVINELQVNDTGRYRCEVIDGLEDDSVTVDLELQGKIFVFEFGPQRESGWINSCGGHKKCCGLLVPRARGSWTQ